MKRLLALLLTVTSGVALAQTGTVNPSPDVPPGGCMPIGLTASGEIVFPIQCKEFIERQRGKALEQKPAGVEEKPATKQSEGVAPNSKPAIKPVETVPLPKRVEDAPRERAKSRDDRYCFEHYRSYDPESGTYTGYDGQRRPCR
jgi:hypothetical protein